ncbi:MAG: glycosyltransferase [Bryobacteraceae bacterium]|nr:glycosyltransferase [Bryobacteraceae bacterium]
MRVVIFCHSIISDWNHGNAHFVRGVATEFQARGADVRIFEPREAWSVQNLAAEAPAALDDYRTAYPQLESVRYDQETLDLDEALDGADLALVHEWNEPALIGRIGRHRRRRRGYQLFFHDTHHRALSEPESIAALDLSGYDGVLAFGESLRRVWALLHPKVPCWTWHEAADPRVFRPMPSNGGKRDLAWIGNWGDGERTEELEQFLLAPARSLRLSGCVYGVRYPEEALVRLAASGLEYGGWTPNYQVPSLFARYAFTVHVPRRFYACRLPGIPTIRVFEALACGIPLICAPWQDSENLFTPGEDFLMARSGDEMRRSMRLLLEAPDFAAEMAARGRRTVLERHTCAHRVDELLEIAAL